MKKKIQKSKMNENENAREEKKDSKDKDTFPSQR